MLEHLSNNLLLKYCSKVTTLSVKKRVSLLTNLLANIRVSGKGNVIFMRGVLSKITSSVLTRLQHCGTLSGNAALELAQGVPRGPKGPKKGKRNNIKNTP